MKLTTPGYGLLSVKNRMITEYNIRSISTYVNFPVIFAFTRCIQIPDTLLPPPFESFVTTFPFLTRVTYIAFYAVSSVTAGNSLGRGNPRYSRGSWGSWRTSRTLSRA